MALLPILEYPDARLKRIASPVTEFTPAIKKLVNDMAETMYAAPGIGLAATQVDVHKRVIVIDVSQDRVTSRSSSTPKSSKPTARSLAKKVACRCRSITTTCAAPRM
jgi:peptide deformylase